MAVSPTNKRQAGGTDSLVSTVDADNKVVRSVDGTTATETLTSPDGTKTVQLFAANAGAGVKVNGTAVLGAQGAAITDVAATGVVTPANVAYTQADQTALADAVLELKAQVNLILARMRAGTPSIAT